MTGPTLRSRAGRPYPSASIIRSTAKYRLRCFQFLVGSFLTCSDISRTSSLYPSFIRSFGVSIQGLATTRPFRLRQMMLVWRENDRHAMVCAIGLLSAPLEQPLSTSQSEGLAGYCDQCLGEKAKLSLRKEGSLKPSVNVWKCSFCEPSHR